ncbi:EAL domain-containing protein (plasmid) [Arthrobacter sp. G.S.26]|uniref:EAL domain-containing protein n=1 Tax=Arthrobacter sp. G.S.26 TaxID=3433706 RepID=UPI003D780AFC
MTKMVSRSVKRFIHQMRVYCRRITKSDRRAHAAPRIWITRELIFATLLGLLIIISAVGAIFGMATHTWAPILLIASLLVFIAFGLITVQINSTEKRRHRPGTHADTFFVVLDISKSGQIIALNSNSADIEKDLRRTMLASNVHESYPYKISSSERLPAPLVRRGWTSTLLADRDGQELPALVRRMDSNEVAKQRILFSVESTTQRSCAKLETVAKIFDESYDIFYQEIIDLDSGRRIGREALTRFHGLDSPEPVFQFARTQGFAEFLELSTARRTLENVSKNRITDTVFINLSAKTCVSSGFDRLMHDFGSILERIVIEINETSFNEEIQLLEPALRRYRDQGARIAFDDFGTGTTNITDILTIRPDFIKLDRTLTANIHRETIKLQTIKCLVAWCVLIDCKLIAEGIELEAELTCLRSINVFAGQGYFIGHPRPLIS